MSPFIKVFTVPGRMGENLSDYRKTRHLDDASKRAYNELLAARNKLRRELGLMGRAKITPTPEGKVAYDNYQTLKKLIAEIDA